MPILSLVEEESDRNDDEQDSEYLDYDIDELLDEDNSFETRPHYRHIEPSTLLKERKDEINDLEIEETRPTHRPQGSSSLVASGKTPSKWSDFSSKERELYNSALFVYEDALQSGNDKIRLSAAKDILALHAKKEELENKKELDRERLDRGNTYNQINISVESVQRALQDALYGFQGGFKLLEEGNTHERVIDPRESDPPREEGNTHPPRDTSVERPIRRKRLSRATENVVLPVAGLESREEGRE